METVLGRALSLLGIVLTRDELVSGEERRGKEERERREEESGRTESEERRGRGRSRNRLWDKG